ncbi:MAG: hypothetical protein V7K15_17315 [Nostoc sp.]
MLVARLYIYQHWICHEYVKILISTDGQSGIQNAYADGYAYAEVSDISV